MVTLHIAKWLEQEGFGTLDTDIFWEEAPLDSNGKPKDGIWVEPVGDPRTSRFSTSQSFDIYSRYKNKVTGSQKLEAIYERIKQVYNVVCILPTVPPHSLAEYYNVRLRNTSFISSVGSDAQDKVVRVISAEVQYNINQEAS